MTDCIVLLPLLVYVLTRTKWRWLKWMTMVVLAPPLAVWSTHPRPYSYLLQIALVVYLCSLVYDSLRSRHEQAGPADPTRPDPVFG